MERDATTANFKAEGDAVIYIGAPRRGLGGSEYLSWCHKLVTGDAPELDLAFEKSLQDSLLAAIRKGWIRSAHDISDGGLATTLAESCLFGGKGATVDLAALGGATREVLFSEAQSGVVISVDSSRVDDILTHFGLAGVPAHVLGTVGGSTLDIAGVGAIAVSDMAELHGNAIRLKVS